MPGRRGDLSLGEMCEKSMGSPERSATEVRDLRSGTPIWRAYPSKDFTPTQLTSGIETDVLIIGAGISGALMAEAVTAHGLSTVLIDRRLPGHGSTSASTALLQFEIDTPLIHLVDEIGLQRAARAWCRSYRAVQDLGALIQRLEILCDFAPRNAVYLSGNVLDPGAMQRECALRQSVGLPTVFLERSDLHGLAGIDRKPRSIHKAPRK
jgi:hypothetical protein